MTIIGKIKRIEDIVIVSEKFKAQSLIVETEEQYPQTLDIQFSNDKIDNLSNFNSGDKVKITISLRGKEVTTKEGKLKVYNTLSGWKIEKTI